VWRASFLAWITLTDRRTALSRSAIWLVIGVAAVGAVMLADVSRLLGEIESAGRRAYDARVFTGFKAVFTDTSDLADAIALWRDAARDAAGSFGVLRLLATHLAVDALAFTPAYSLLVGLVLRRVGAPARVAATMAATLFAIDFAETAATFGVLVVGRLQLDGAGWLVGLQALTFAKWLALAGAVVLALVRWRRPVDPAPSFRDALHGIRRAHAGGRRHPAVALASLVLIVAVFAAFIALPAGGPLDQMPDVLRGQLAAETPRLVWLLSGAALPLLAAAIASAGLLASDPPTIDAPTGAPRGAPRAPLSDRHVLPAALALSVALAVAARVVDGAFHATAAGPFLVACGVAGAAWLVDRARRVKPEGPEEAEQPDARVVPNEVPDPLRPDDDEATPRWIGALAGTVIVAGSLGFVRAAFLPWLLHLPNGSLPWWAAATAGVFGALVGGAAVQQVVIRLSRRGAVAAPGAAPARRRVTVATGVTVAALALWLAVDPAQGARWGTTGALALGFAALAQIVGLLALAARRGRPWRATQVLGLGARTPWLALVTLTWLGASLLNVDGVYHDTRVDSRLPRFTPRYPTVDSAFAGWLAAQSGACAPGAGEPLPLILVAAPGGGIRAAYWTASVLDRLFDAGPCAPRRLFAVSGVSGGSVGATAWVAARARGVQGAPVVARMAHDRGLAAAAVGLLLRDLYQPLTGLTHAWGDRAALLEDGWAASARGTLATPEIDPAAAWSALGDGAGWVPALFLNASSVTDGCRIVVANVGGLPATRGADCAAMPAGGGAAGPVTGAIDPFPGLRARSETTACGAPGAGVRVFTAALLSARFPLVSPSGALVRCVLDPPTMPGGAAHAVPAVSYAVDGGYYENSGLLTLLQAWSAIERRVRAHNDSAPGGVRVAPWLVVVDNGYRSSAQAGSQRRPLELVAPLRALGGNRLTSQAMLEQLASWTLAHDDAPCGAPSCVVVLAPRRHPSVTAPLGWVLSAMSREDLRGQIETPPAAGAPPDPSVCELARQLATTLPAWCPAPR
jgi:hypothetical protein